jgi:hypothetical protein
VKGKWTIWIILGIGVAVILYIMTKGQVSALSGTSSTPVQTSVLVPASLPADQTTTGQSTAAGTSSEMSNNSLSEQNNIIGNSPNSTVWNGTIPNFVNWSSVPMMGNAPQQNGQQPTTAASSTFGATYG